MTERERVENAYAKVRKKYIDIVDEGTIKELALKIEQRRTLWISLAFLLGSVACMLAFLLGPDWITGSTVFFIVCSFEYFRTIFNSSKIYYHFLGEHNTKYEGILTYEQITKGKNTGSSFQIVKATLYDKTDADDSAVSLIFHKYNLFFKLDDNFTTTGYRVKRRVYLKAPLDGEYILILSDRGNVISAYLSNAWKIDPNLFYFCAFDGYAHNRMLDSVGNAPKNTKKKSRLALDLLLCAANILIYFLPMFFVVFLPILTFLTTKRAIAGTRFISTFNAVLGYCSVILVLFALCL